MSPPPLGRPSTLRLVTLIGALTAAVALAGVGACSTGTGPHLPSRVVTAAQIAQLERHWARWRAVGPSAYRYQWRRSCWCAPEFARIDVRDGQVTDARDIATGQPLPLRRFEPIDSLFPFAIREAERGALKRIAYHPELGYPVKIVSGTPNPDDGVSIEVSELSALP
jgi:hypothetical protein